MAVQKSEVVVTIDDRVVPPGDDISIQFLTSAEGPPKVVLFRNNQPVTGRWRVSLFAEQSQD